MARATWPLERGRPVVEVALGWPASSRQSSRVLLADTGAGSARASMDLILGHADDRRFNVGDAGTIRLGGAMTGEFPAFWVSVSIPTLGFAELCLAVAVPAALLPRPLQGIACFRFLNRFAYGNFGDADGFGLEVP